MQLKLSMTRLVLILSLIIFTHSEFAFSAKQCQQLFSSANKKRASQIDTAFEPETMLKAAMVLRTTNDPHMLNKKIARAYAKHFEVSVDDLASPHIIDWLTKTANGIEVVKNEEANVNSEKINFENGYGFRLLPDDDPAFTNPQFRNELLEVTLKNQGLGYSEDRIADKLKIYSKKFQNLLQAAVDYDLSRKNQKPFWMTVHGFFQSGSDANNALYDIATDAWRRRKKEMQLSQEPLATQDGEILFLSKIYGAGRGKMSRVGIWGNDRSLKDWVVESPLLKSLDQNSANEIHDVEILENAALLEIENKFRDPQYRIGGFFLEPIIGHQGTPALVYRKEFLLAVQKLCRKYEVPIFADEILSGGARTGRFFGFMHYDGFVPDYITFGKALFTSGILRVHEGKTSAYVAQDPAIEQAGLYPTLAVQPEALLKSIAFLDAVNTRKLSLKAEEIGRYFIEQVRKIKPTSHVRGVGLMINNDVGYGSGRLLPSLTLSKEQIDQYISDFLKSREKAMREYEAEKIAAGNRRDQEIAEKAEKEFTARFKSYLESHQNEAPK